MAVNFVAVGDGFCFARMNGPLSADTQHQQLPKDCLLLGVGLRLMEGEGSRYFAQSHGELQKN